MKRQRDFSKIAKLENGCVRERERERIGFIWGFDSFFKVGIEKFQK
jgi:hypothetical protein